jgi:hypothetical protein
LIFLETRKKYLAGIRSPLSGLAGQSVSNNATKQIQNGDEMDTTRFPCHLFRHAVTPFEPRAIRNVARMKVQRHPSTETSGPVTKAPGT